MIKSIFQDSKESNPGKAPGKPSALDSILLKKERFLTSTRTKYVLAASFTIIAFFTPFMTFTINSMDSEDVLIKNVASDELVSWYGNLGEKSDDELENLDTYNSISYLLQETK